MSKTKVRVGNEPFLARSAMQAFLAADPRYDAILVPLSGSVATDDPCDVVIVSDDQPAAASVVIRIFESTVELTSQGCSQTFTYEGVRWLADLISASTEAGKGGARDP